MNALRTWMYTSGQTWMYTCYMLASCVIWGNVPCERFVPASVLKMSDWTEADMFGNHRWLPFVPTFHVYTKRWKYHRSAFVQRYELLVLVYSHAAELPVSNWTVLMQYYIGIVLCPVRGLLLVCGLSELSEQSRSFLSLCSRFASNTHAVGKYNICRLWCNSLPPFLAQMPSTTGTSINAVYIQQ